MRCREVQQWPGSSRTLAGPKLRTGLHNQLCCSKALTNSAQPGRVLTALTELALSHEL